MECWPSLHSKKSSCLKKQVATPRWIRDPDIQKTGERKIMNDPLLTFCPSESRHNTASTASSSLEKHSKWVSTLLKNPNTFGHCTAAYAVMANCLACGSTTHYRCDAVVEFVSEAMWKMATILRSGRFFYRWWIGKPIQEPIIIIPGYTPAAIYHACDNTLAPLDNF